jgi:hypothetical protein
MAAVKTDNCVKIIPNRPDYEWAAGEMESLQALTKSRNPVPIELS